MEAIIDPKPSLRLPEDLGHEFAIGATTVEIVMAGAQVVQARGDASHCRGLALGKRVLGERRVDADMHVRIDATWKCETIFGVEHILGLLGLNFRRKSDNLSILDRDIETIDRRLVRANDASILDDGIENLVHAEFLTSSASRRMT